MFQDRRRYPRYTVLLKAVAVTERERLDVVCTNIGPAGAFFTSRNLPAITDRVTIELRAGGLGSAVVELVGIVTRLSPIGGTWPSGFAITWSVARCALGAEPLFQVLTDVLRLGEVSLTDVVSAELAASFDLDAWLRGVRRQMENAHPGRDSSTAIRRVQGQWSPPMVGVAAQGPPARAAGSVDELPPARVAVSHAGRPSGSVRQPTTTHGTSHTVPAAEAVGWTESAPRPRPPTQQFGEPEPPRAPSVAAPGAMRNAALSDDDPVGFDQALAQDKTPVDEPPDLTPVAASYDDSGWQSVDAPASSLFDSAQPTSSPGMRPPTISEDDAQSWPVWALAPGERRPNSRSGYGAPASAEEVIGALKKPGTRTPHAAQPPVADIQGLRGARRAASDAESVLPEGTPAPGSLRQPRPTSQTSGITPLTRLPGEKSPKAVDVDLRKPRTTDLPVTYLHHNLFVPGRMVMLGEQVTAILAEGEPPDPDEAVVVNMPVQVEGMFRTVYLNGKLRGAPQDTEQGKRFVLQIDRVEEGKQAKGAFKQFLSQLPVA